MLVVARKKKVRVRVERKSRRMRKRRKKRKKRGFFEAALKAYS